MMKQCAYARLMAVAVLCGTVGSAACGDSKTPSDAGPVADMDGVDGNIDAGGEPGDAGSDAAAPTDADADGVPAATDCDDADAAIGRSATEECSSTCAAGIRTCADGVWAECNAPTDCACPTVGATRTAACGNCGLLSQRCSDVRVWEDVSPCLGEGECAPAAFERDTSRCGDRARICDDACAWRPWAVTTPQGECDPTTTRIPTGIGCTLSEVAESVCSATCAWADACRFGCERPASASRTGASPICIPDGPFILGSTVAGASAAPPTTVTLSTYYVDRDMVTAGRYRACVAAAACAAPEVGAPFHRLVDGAIAVQLPYASAAAFCDWDGGRLPTEYEWEKAARGPAPDERLLPHSGPSTFDETYFYDGRIISPAGASTSRPAVELLSSDLPRAYSPFGAHQMGAMVLEYTSTLYKPDYADLSAVDPGDQPGAGPERTVRGASGSIVVLGGFIIASGPPTSSVVARARDPRDTFVMTGFRCVY